MKLLLLLLSFSVLLQGCGYRFIVPENRIIFEDKGVVLCAYDNRWYFFPTDPCAPFGEKRLGSGFPINDLERLAWICEKATKVSALVPGREKKENMPIYVSPVSIRYCYQRKAEFGQEAVILKEGELLLNYRNLRDLSIVDFEPFRCETSKMQ